ncbi:MAG TPA: TadE/TadG family type IV pilus assembly protein [Bryobacteraceae bacterium]|nr:TadE/TadG family type IV pilus assembly protein [Bryobacteraceae bacterium]
MKRGTQRGNALIETVMFLPILILLLVGMVSLARIYYTYYTAEKILYNLARYVSVQQGANFCDSADPVITAAINYALTGAGDGSGTPVLPGLTADMIQVQPERFSTATGTLGACDCSAIGCDQSQGARPPDFIEVTIPNGYPVQPIIPGLQLDPIPLRPHVMVPFEGT